jgi:hypothetical protein
MKRITHEVILMNTLVRSLIYAAVLLIPSLAQAETEIAGLTLPDNYDLAGQTLVLNGAGVRSKFFVDIYIGALYLAAASKDASQALSTAGPKSMQMHVLYKELEAGKIAQGWKDGFAANLSDSQYSQLEKRLERFNSLFPALRKGDTVAMDYIPGQGTGLSINRKHLDTIAGEDFFTALMKVWIGEHPADGNLKKGLLGH